jgi:SAM-dependent methyltransferase
VPDVARYCAVAWDVLRNERAGIGLLLYCRKHESPRRWRPGRGLQGVVDVDQGTENPIARAFENGFMALSIADQTAMCDSYDLAPLFRKWIPDHQPVLEAGCGSGRWVAWAVANGWKAIGVDWSKSLIDRASAEIPEGEFVHGDMRSMPLEDNSIGSIISLGAVEHVIDGPGTALAEYRRVLRPGGVAFITVPFLGPVRRISRAVQEPVVRAKASPWLRARLGKFTVQGRSLAQVRAEKIPGWAIDCMATEGGWEFYQYQLTRPRMRTALGDAGLTVVDEFVFAHDEGVLHNFGRLAGTFNYERGMVDFTPAGRLLKRALPLSVTGHMLGYVVRG